MYEELSHLQESADISIPTTARLNQAHPESQARIREAEASLSTFYFDDAHFSQEDLSPTVRAASDRFRKFLRHFYEREYQTWPVRRGKPGLWLDRIIVGRLQEDFSALYECIADKTTEWNDDDDDKSEDRQKRALLRSINSLNFGLDAEDVRMLGVLRNLDCRLNASHIPHPYPLLPTSVPALPPPAKKPAFGGKKKDKARESRSAHAYVEASNASRLSHQHAHNDLLEAFTRFEIGDQPGNVDPREARRERWIIIYCVLQTLAGISVDVPHLYSNGDVSYFLNTRLQDLPPWSPTDRIFMEASREQSHCWKTARISASDHFSSTRSNSYPKSETTAQGQPLSPESLSDTYTFFDSKRDTNYEELEAIEMSQKAGFSPVPETEIGLGRSLPPDYASVPSKFAAVAGIDRYATKPLPLRPAIPKKSA